MLDPSSIAIVGATERQVNLRRAMKYNEAAGIPVYIVNPRHREVFDRAAYASLADIGEPIDAVLAIVNAELTAPVIEEAA
jgi:predicted CoA-binding protein